MSEQDIEIRTCSNSLLQPGRCCAGTCNDDAVSAVIYGDLVEHARCASHDHEIGIVARKPLLWSATWGPWPQPGGAA